MQQKIMGLGATLKTWLNINTSIYRDRRHLLNTWPRSRFFARTNLTPCWERMANPAIYASKLRNHVQFWVNCDVWHKIYLTWQDIHEHEDYLSVVHFPGRGREHMVFSKCHWKFRTLKPPARPTLSRASLGACGDWYAQYYSSSGNFPLGRH